MCVVASQTGLTTTKLWTNFASRYGIDMTADPGAHLLSQTGMYIPEQRRMHDLIPLAMSFLPACKHLFVKCGHLGVLTLSRVSSSEGLRSAENWAEVVGCEHIMIHPAIHCTGGVVVCLIPPSRVLRPEEIKTVTGAGDSFVGWLVGELSQDANVLDNIGKLYKVVKRAQQASQEALLSSEAVSPRLSCLN